MMKVLLEGLSLPKIAYILSKTKINDKGLHCVVHMYNIQYIVHICTDSSFNQTLILSN